jgi:hypothetical protein
MVRIFLLFQSLQLAFLVLEDVREESRICGKKSFLYQDSDFLVFLVVFVCGGTGKKMKSSKKFANFAILAILRVKSLR